MNIMLAGAPIAYWIGFHGVVLLLIACDLAFLHHGKAESEAESREQSQAESKTTGDLLLVLLLLMLAASFGLWLGHVQGRRTGLEFASGYLIELSLSIDNLFVFLLMFRSSGLGQAAQRKALLFGIAGAIVMRGIFIFLGIALLERFAWVQFVFGAVLLFAALRLIRQREPATAGRWTERLTRRWSGSPHALLFSVVVAVEIVDLLFALDSIPAVLAVTHQPFVVYTSNICAVLGLRSLYFLLAGLLERLRFLHFGLAAILGFVGGKMLLARWVEVPVAASLGVIVLLVLSATAASLLAPARR